jgi:hypothetical protein
MKPDISAYPLIAFFIFIFVMWAYARIQIEIRERKQRHTQTKTNIVRDDIIAELQELHDKQGHIWVDCTNHESTQQEFFCALPECRATKTEPFPKLTLD